MADLPQDRVSPDLPPFTYVGIDYFGPTEVKVGRAPVNLLLPDTPSAGMKQLYTFYILLIYHINIFNK